MSELTTSFTFRLTHDDKAALAELAERLGCDRGAALRRIIRQRDFRLTQHTGGCLTTAAHTIPIRLKTEHDHD